MWRINVKLEGSFDGFHIAITCYNIQETRASQNNVVSIVSHFCLPIFSKSNMYLTTFVRHLGVWNYAPSPQSFSIRPRVQFDS